MNGTILPDLPRVDGFSSACGNRAAARAVVEDIAGHGETTTSVVYSQSLAPRPLTRDILG